jgi:glycine oxidase
MDAAAPLITHVVRAHNIYLVPRRDGRLILGATVEEKGFDATLTAGGVLALLEAAWRVVPAVEELPIEEMWVGHRPGSPDDAPILGPGPVEGLIYATGHHRNGILLAPVTAQMIAQLVIEGITDDAIAPFGLARFTPAGAAVLRLDPTLVIPGRREAASPEPSNPSPWLLGSGLPRSARAPE